MKDEKGDLCAGCSAPLQIPHIQCTECTESPLLICLRCFSKGYESATHESNHCYTVVKNDFSLIDPSWTAGEEVKLLDAIGDCGLGNWKDVARQVRTKTEQQCERHYTWFYLERPKPPLPKLDETEVKLHPSPVVFKYGEDPPRPTDGSVFQAEMSGYVPPRGEFILEYDNYLELEVKDIYFNKEDEEEEPFDRELKLAVLDVFHNRMRERHRRRQIIRDYGIINIKRVNVYHRRYDKTLGSKADVLRSFAKLDTPLDHDKYLEALHYECELKQQIKKLQEYRANGITTHRGANVYDKLKKRREENKRKGSILSDVLAHVQCLYLKDETACQQFLIQQAVLDKIAKGIPISLPNAPRKSASPLDITCLPGYDRLTDKERDLCSSARLVPESYLEFKRMLINECNKQGYLKLMQARNIVKIDVNKTRKVYDFLLQEGHINRDAMM